MLQALDGPSKQGKLSGITTSAPVEVKIGAAAHDERKIITLQGDGKFYIYFADENIIPNAATIIAGGFLQYKNAKESYEAANTQKVYILAVSGTVDVVVAERA